MKMPKELKYLQVLILLVASIAYAGVKNALPIKNAAVDNKYYLVERVVDGDTLKLSGNKRVRLIGIDTPESYYSEKLLRDSKKTKQDVATIMKLGKKATEFTRQLVGGKKVRLEYDVEKKDRYGRLLAYVYLEDGTFVNARIVEEGYAQVMTVPPNVKYADLFLKLQKKAREENRGLWKPY